MRQAAREMAAKGKVAEAMEKRGPYLFAEAGTATGKLIFKDKPVIISKRGTYVGQWDPKNDTMEGLGVLLWNDGSL